MILLVDNHDSFTYNIAQYLYELKQEVVIYENDKVTLKELATLNLKAIVIGPGPCTPDTAGITLDIIRYYTDKLPILGICLGHQAIAQAFGATIVHAKEVMHGRISQIYHNRQGIFDGIPVPFNATRYHSLVVKSGTLPPCLEITAWIQTFQDKADHSSTTDEIMGIKHRKLPIEGVQFHPESILSEFGYHILNNFLLKNNLAHLKNTELPEVS